MRFIRRITIAVFICSAVLWGVGYVSKLNQDTEAPVIKADSDVIYVKAGCDDEELKKGLTASDDEDGDVTKDIIVGTISPFIEKGVSRVEYLVFDQSNNVGSYVRTVHFEDYSSPYLVLTAPLMYKQNSEIVLSDRLFAVDRLEGDISNKIRLSTSGVTQSEAGIYELKVEVKNSYGDLVDETLLLNIMPYENDRGYIKLKEYLVYLPAGAEISPLDYVEKAVDSEGTEMPLESVVITQEVDTNKPGTGQFRYEMRDQYGHTTITYLAVIVTE